MYQFYPEELAIGFAWIITEFNRVSDKGRNFLSIGSFSSSSRASNPSITLEENK